MKFIIHTDGGARGNPGPAAIGIIIEPIKPTDTNKLKIIEIGKRIGETTNNVAEYTAVREALKEIKSLRQRRTSLWQDKSKVKSKEKEFLEINFHLDSNLVVNQLNGTFKVKDSNLRNLLMEIRMLEQEVGGLISYNHIPREQNRRADFLVNKALDND